MKNLLDLLNEGNKKNEKYYTPISNLSKIQEAYSSNILNMKTVKEGTASAGSFCNKIMEIAFSYAHINVTEARTISDVFQRIALDSKHNGLGTSYKDSDWYMLAQALGDVKFNSNLETSEKIVLNILKTSTVASTETYSEEIATMDELSEMF
ncbi:MAG: hypothetical protein ACRC0G_02960 [Fusobacteriaceae bacterium]